MCRKTVKAPAKWLHEWEIYFLLKILYWADKSEALGNNFIIIFDKMVGWGVIVGRSS